MIGQRQGEGCRGDLGLDRGVELIEFGGLHLHSEQHSLDTHKIAKFRVLQSFAESSRVNTQQLLFDTHEIVKSGVLQSFTGCSRPRSFTPPSNGILLTFVEKIYV
jgi:hypothetical protein